MNEIIEKLQQTMDISAYNVEFIKSVIQRRLDALKIDDLADYYGYIENNASEMELIEQNLKNSFSLFFRNRLTFENMQQLLLPHIAMQKAVGEEVRIWSAGCAGGHEPYSMAIAFESFNKISSKKLKYRIFATDKDYSQLQYAVLGEYSKKEIGNLTLSETNLWFKTIGNKYKINVDLKKQIQFELFDLLDNECLCPPSSIFGSFDVVMCANVLIYYKAEFQQLIISNFKKCMSNNSIIITGEAERELFINSGFVELYPQSCIFRQ